ARGSRPPSGRRADRDAPEGDPQRPDPSGPEGVSAAACL
ncbi:hicB protein, partial [Pseudomonas sp. FEN]